MRSLGRTMMGFCPILLGIMGCTDNVGYVEIKTFPGFNVPLYLDAVSIRERRRISEITRHCWVLHESATGAILNPW